jgi:hypothetical protein
MGIAVFRLKSSFRSHSSSSRSRRSWSRRRSCLELQGGAVIADDLEGRHCVFLAGLYRAEREIAEKLSASNFPPPTRSVWEESKHGWIAFANDLAHFPTGRPT